jgi:adenylate kinase
LITQRLGCCHLSTGDVFRAAKGNDHQTPAMAAALQCMKKGALVPDSTVWEMVRERARCVRCQGGFVLDGFPRTLSQANALQQLLDQENIHLDGVLNYELPIADIVARISGRRVCSKCKAVFHETQHPPRVKGYCDQCGGQLAQREDDRAEAVKVRMEVYERDTAPLIEFYRNLGSLISISANGSPEEIFDRSLNALQAANPS